MKAGTLTWKYMKVSPFSYLGSVTSLTARKYSTELGLNPGTMYWMDMTFFHIGLFEKIEIN